MMMLLLLLLLLLLMLMIDDADDRLRLKGNTRAPLGPSLLAMAAPATPAAP